MRASMRAAVDLPMAMEPVRPMTFMASHQTHAAFDFVPQARINNHASAKKRLKCRTRLMQKHAQAINRPAPAIFC